MVTSADIANRAGQLIGDNQPPIIGSGNYPTPIFDTSPLGIAATVLYNGVVNTVGREFGWDFSRNTVVLALSGNAAPSPWSLEYLYPGNGIQIRQLMPATMPDPNNPTPVRWEVANDIVASVPKKVILTNLAAALAVFSNEVDENLWDPGFTEAVVRLLSSELAMAIAGRPDTERNALENFQGFGSMAESRDS